MSCILCARALSGETLNPKVASSLLSLSLLPQTLQLNLTPQTQTLQLAKEDLAREGGPAVFLPMYSGKWLDPCSVPGSAVQEQLIEMLEALEAPMLQGVM